MGDTTEDRGRPTEETVEEALGDLLDWRRQAMELDTAAKWLKVELDLDHETAKDLIQEHGVVETDSLGNRMVHSTEVG